MAGGAEAAHAVEDAVEQPEKHEAEGIVIKQESFGAAGVLPGGGGRRRHRSADLGKPLPEIIKQLPAGELLLVDCFLGAAHMPSKSEGVVEYK